MRDDLIKNFINMDKWITINETLEGHKVFLATLSSKQEENFNEF